jgi:hypothetical protein
LEGDIRGCFDNISHEWMLRHIPTDRVVLRRWLKAGYLENRTLFPTEAGTPQGGIISPTLANMTLNGLEELLHKTFRVARVKGQLGKYIWPKVNFVRYADDFIITGRSKEQLENGVRPMVEQFLRERGLELSPEKTCVTHMEEAPSLCDAFQEKHARVLGESPGGTSPPSDSKAGQPDTCAQPHHSGLGQLSSACGVHESIQKSGKEDLASRVAVGQTQTSRKIGWMGDPEILAPNRSTPLVVCVPYRTEDSGRQTDLVATGQSSRHQNRATP